jgi:uncharacterized membrane protein YeaQ/YmgE (transglycosylase-associated protein family)
LNQLIEIGFGILITIVLGLGVTPFIEKKVPKLEKPDSIKDEDWGAITKRSGAGEWIGFFERILSFISFTVSEYAIFGGWLAFKLAAKWEVWKNIVQVPSNLEGISPLVWYQVRKAFGSWILSRFLLGTLMNALIGAIGAYSGRYCCEYFGWLCSR